MFKKRLVSQSILHIPCARNQMSLLLYCPNPTPHCYIVPFPRPVAILSHSHAPLLYCPIPTPGCYIVPFPRPKYTYKYTHQYHLFRLTCSSEMTWIWCRALSTPSFVPVILTTSEASSARGTEIFVAVCISMAFSFVPCFPRIFLWCSLGILSSM